MSEKKANPLYQPGITKDLSYCVIKTDPKLSDPIIKQHGWTYDKENGKHVIVETGSYDIQQLVDSSRGQDMRSIINRQTGATPMEKLQAAVDKGLITPEAVPTEDVDLTLAPQSRFEGEKLARSVKFTTEAINAELGTDFAPDELISDIGSKAIKDYIQKRIDEAVKAQGVKANGEESK